MAERNSFTAIREWLGQQGYGHAQQGSYYYSRVMPCTETPRCLALVHTQAFLTKREKNFKYVKQEPVELVL
jgi:hypothetical protein